MDKVYDLLIIGGGASGFFAGLEARRAGFRGSLAILEKEEENLRKVLASGNGRCNLVNILPLEGRMHGRDPAFALDILDHFPASLVLDRFTDLGLLTVEDREGRIYPRSFQSRSVAMVLRRAADRAGLDLIQPAKAIRVEKQEDLFRVGLEEGGTLLARALILAAGSLAAPELGGTRLGYDLLASLGHGILPPVPALVPLELAPHPLLRYGQGVRFRGRADFLGREGTTARSEGEFLITSYGISGIAGMDLGRAAGRAELGQGSPQKGIGRLLIDFLPEWEEERVRDLLEQVDDGDWRTGLAGLVPDKIGRALLALPDRKGKEERVTASDLARLVKGLDLEVLGTRGFTFAYVAAGGALTDEFSPSTLMSRKVDGLFACGEVLDVDGDTGGYNLLWAFASGLVAGRGAAAWLQGALS